MIAIFLTVRSDSTRLPNKAFLPIGLDKKTCLEFLIDRLKSSRKADKIIVCTTDRKIDDIVEHIALSNFVEIYRGSLEDKLERWNGACLHHGIEFFVTADGDDLFCDPKMIDSAIQQYEEDRSIDFIKNDNVIPGAFTYGISAKALRKVCVIKDTTDTEMMWVYFTETGLFNVAHLKTEERFCRNDIRMTLDYEEDYKFFSTVIEQLSLVKANFDLDDIINLIDENPHIKEINLHKHSEWKKNQQKRTKLVLKKMS